MSEQRPGLAAYLNTAALTVLPQHLLARGMYHLARCHWPLLKDGLIRFVTRQYGVNLSEAANSDPASYDSFNAFFTRALKSDARPIDPAADSIVSPADGRVSQAGTIRNGRIIQAKGHDYSSLELLGGNRALAEHFDGGSFATIYLSPKDYHRVHMPLAGRLTGMDFVPGRLFSVSDATTQLVPGLFARNERVICHFDTAVGPVAQILVGAIFVGSMETIWHGEVCGASHQVSRWDYADHEPIELAKGAEMGRFNMGSTVITLLPSGTVEWNDALQAGNEVCLGQAIGNLRKA